MFRFVHFVLKLAAIFGRRQVKLFIYFVLLYHATNVCGLLGVALLKWNERKSVDLFMSRNDKRG